MLTRGGGQLKRSAVPIRKTSFCTWILRIPWHWSLSVSGPALLWAVLLIKVAKAASLAHGSEKPTADRGSTGTSDSSEAGSITSGATSVERKDSPSSPAAPPSNRIVWKTRCWEATEGSNAGSSSSSVATAGNSCSTAVGSCSTPGSSLATVTVPPL